MQSNFGNNPCATKTIHQSEVVNLIRKTFDLATIDSDDSSPKRRRRSVLHPTEELALRLWAAQADYPLTNFPDPDSVGSIEATSPEERMDSGEVDIETTTVAFVDMDVEDGQGFHSQSKKGESDIVDGTSVSHRESVENRDQAAAVAKSDTEDLAKGNIAPTSLVMDVEEIPIVEFPVNTSHVDTENHNPGNGDSSNPGLPQETQQEATSMQVEMLGDAEIPVIACHVDTENHNSGDGDSSNTKTTVSSANDAEVNACLPRETNEEATSMEVEKLGDAEIPVNASHADIENHIPGTGESFNTKTTVSSATDGEVNACLPQETREEATSMEVEKLGDDEITADAVPMDVEGGTTLGLREECHSLSACNPDALDETSVANSISKTTFAKDGDDSLKVPEVAAPLEQCSLQRLTTNTYHLPSEPKGEIREVGDRTSMRSLQSPERENNATSTAKQPQGESQAICDRTKGLSPQTPQRRTLVVSTTSNPQDDINPCSSEGKHLVDKAHDGDDRSSPSQQIPSRMNEAILDTEVTSLEDRGDVEYYNPSESEDNVVPREYHTFPNSEEVVIEEGIVAVDLSDQKKLLELRSPLRELARFEDKSNSQMYQNVSESMVDKEKNDCLLQEAMPPLSTQSAAHDDEEDDADGQFEETKLDENYRSMQDSMLPLYTQPSLDSDCEDDDDIDQHWNGDFHADHGQRHPGEIPMSFLKTSPLKEGFTLPPPDGNNQREDEEPNRDDIDIMSSFDPEKREPWERELLEDTTSR
jgi:hypothetical protein